MAEGSGDRPIAARRSNDRGEATRASTSPRSGSG